MTRSATPQAAPTTRIHGIPLHPSRGISRALQPFARKLTRREELKPRTPATVDEALLTQERQLVHAPLELSVVFRAVPADERAIVVTGVTRQLHGASRQRRQPARQVASVRHPRRIRD